MAARQPLPPSERAPRLEVERVAYGGAHRLAPGQTVREQVGDGSELVRALLGREPVRGDERGVAREQQQVRLDLLVPAIDLVERSAEAPVGLGDPRPRRGIRKRSEERR